MQEKHLKGPAVDVVTALEHFWQGRDHPVLLLTAILCNPLCKNSSDGNYIIASGNVLFAVFLKSC